MVCGPFASTPYCRATYGGVQRAKAPVSGFTSSSLGWRAFGVFWNSGSRVKEAGLSSRFNSFSRLAWVVEIARSSAAFDECKAAEKI